VGYFLFLICTWEAVALAAQRLGFDWAPPTITNAMWELRDHGPWAAMIVGAFSAWLYWHLLIEGRG
jgi:hypothetical protein